MNLDNLMKQVQQASNPMMLMMNMLNPQQKQLVEQFKNKPNKEQAEAIAQYCNDHDISKEQLQTIIGMFIKR